MEQTRRRIGTWPRAMAALPLVLALLVSAVRPAMASDGALEREQLAALARQIELADRLADHLAAQAASSSSPERVRYTTIYNTIISKSLSGASYAKPTTPRAADFEAHCQSRTFETEDSREGITALLEKREPRFQGR